MVFTKEEKRLRKLKSAREWELRNPGYNYYENNKEKTLKKNREWREKHKQQKKDMDKKYRDENKDKVNLAKQKWIKENYSYWREIQNRYNRKRRAMIHCIIEEFDTDDWLEKLRITDGICPKCGVNVGVPHLTLDHIYPVSKAYADYKRTGKKRIYTIDDVQPLCNKCNVIKSNRIVVKNEVMKYGVHSK